MSRAYPKASQEAEEKRLREYLFALPVHDPARPKLADKVRGDFETLEKKAHKYLTLAAEYNARKGPSPLHFDGKGIYAKFVASACRRRPVPPLPLAIPEFQSGEPTVAEYIDLFDAANQLISVGFWFSKE